MMKSVIAKIGETMYINKLEKRRGESPTFQEGRFIGNEVPDSVQIEIEVPLHTIEVKDFYEFMKKYPKAGDNPYSDDKLPTNMLDCLTDYLQTLVDEHKLKEFFGGQHTEPEYISLKNWTSRLQENRLNGEFKYAVELDGPF